MEVRDIEGRFVFVGVTAAGVMPQLATPNGLLEPHKIQAALAESILVESPQIPDYRLFVELSLLIVSGLLIAFLINFFAITWGIILAATTMSSVAYLGYYFISIGYLIDVTYLDKMTKIILSNGGTIDKYMGDCIMAFWNAPLPCENHAELAIKSAIEIEQATVELNKQFKEEGLDLPPINVGTGVNSGICIVGNMGSETRFDYSVVGDAVNLSARLEATAGRNDYKQWKIIISEYTKELAGDSFEYEKIDSIMVKGKSEPITIYFPKNLTN